MNFKFDIMPISYAWSESLIMGRFMLMMHTKFGVKIMHCCIITS